LGPARVRINYLGATVRLFCPVLVFIKTPNKTYLASPQDQLIKISFGIFAYSSKQALHSFQKPNIHILNLCRSQGQRVCRACLCGLCGVFVGKEAKIRLAGVRYCAQCTCAECRVPLRPGAVAVCILYGADIWVLRVTKTVQNDGICTHFWLKYPD
jgi:hypothetical protein